MNYPFKTINAIIAITPMGKIFKSLTISRFKKDMLGRIRSNHCYENALLAAQWFIEHGYEVSIVDGFINANDYAFEYAAKHGIEVYSKTNEESNQGSPHRFLFYNGYYFDVTIETLFGVEMLRTNTYTAYRQYEFGAILHFYMDMQKLYGELYFADTITGKRHTYVDGECIRFYYDTINENGEYVFRDSKKVADDIKRLKS